MTTNDIRVFTGKVYVGHVGLFIAASGGAFPVDEHWRHDLLQREEAIRLILEGIRDGGRDWPQGFYHVYVNADPAGNKKEVNVYDCVCSPRPAWSGEGSGER